MYRISLNTFLPRIVFPLVQNEYIKWENYLNILKFCDLKKDKFPILRSVINEHGDTE